MIEAGFERVASIEDVPGDGLLAVTTSAGERICLVRRGERLTALSNVCTHQEFEITLGELLPDGTVECAWHGARFDCRTGVVKQGPATDPLPVYAVRIEGTDICVGPRMSKGMWGGFRESAAVIPPEAGKGGNTI
jgi:nitrite reductase/ring-hydroxylating ferredoxin subunit